jgi:hypothetical protein
MFVLIKKSSPTLFLVLVSHREGADLPFTYFRPHCAAEIFFSFSVFRPRDEHTNTVIHETIMATLKRL